MATGEAPLASLPTFASGPAGRTRCSEWPLAEGAPRHEAASPVLPGHPYLGGGGGRGHRPGEWLSLQPQPGPPAPREAGEFSDLLDLDLILSSSLSHQEPVTRRPCRHQPHPRSPRGVAAQPARPPPAASATRPGRGDPGAATPGSVGGGFLSSREFAPPPTAPVNLADISDVSPSSGFVAELLWPELDPVCIPPPPGGGLVGTFVLKAPECPWQPVRQSVGHRCSHRRPGQQPLGGGGPYSGGSPRVCPKIKREAVSSCTVGRPLEARLGTEPPLSSDHQLPAHDFPLGRQLPSRATPTLAPWNCWAARTVILPWRSPQASIPTLGPTTFPACPTRCRRTAHRAMTKRSCQPVPAGRRSPSQRGGGGRGPGKGRPLTLVITQAVAKPAGRVLISRHTCAPHTGAQRCETFPRWLGWPRVEVCPLRWTDQALWQTPRAVPGARPGILQVGPSPLHTKRHF